MVDGELIPEAQPEHEKMAGASKSKQDINCKMMGGCMMKRTALEMMDARIKHMEARLESMKAARRAWRAWFSKHWPFHQS